MWSNDSIEDYRADSLDTRFLVYVLYVDRKGCRVAMKLNELNQRRLVEFDWFSLSLSTIIMMGWKERWIFHRHYHRRDVHSRWVEWTTWQSIQFFRLIILLHQNQGRASDVNDDFLRFSVVWWFVLHPLRSNQHAYLKYRCEDNSMINFLSEQTFGKTFR